MAALLPWLASVHAFVRTAPRCGPITCTTADQPWFVKTETFKTSLGFPAIKPHLEEHKVWVDGLRSKGMKITSGYRVDAEGRPGGGGLMLFAADDHKSAEELVLQDPLIANDCVDWQLNGWIADVGDIELVDGGAWCERKSRAGEPSMSLNRRDTLAAACTSALVAVLSTMPLPAYAAPPATSAQLFGFGTSKGQPLIGGLGEIGYSRLEEQVSTPKGAKAISINVRFDYPSQFARLPPENSITLVDGNSGLKVYVLTVPLPPETPLAETSKSYLGEALFSPDGALAKGATLDEYKVSKSTMISDNRRRLALKYAVITPANQRTVERRAIADVYEVDGQAYVLLASATSSKWEGTEKERCEKVVDSFVVG